MSSENVLITVRLHTRNGQVETRKCFVLKNKPNFNALVDKLEKLFSCKICHNQCIYIDFNNDVITFSSDEELSLAFCLLKNNELRLEVRDLEQSGLKEDNPSEISTDCSLNSSLSQQNSPPSSSSNEQTVDVTPKTCLFRSLVVPRLARQHGSSSTKLKPTTKIRQSAHNSTFVLETKCVGDNASVDRATYNAGPDTKSDVIRALIRIILWLGKKLN